MATNVKQLHEKKVRLSTQLENLTADTEAKIASVEASHTTKVEELTTAFEANIAKLTEAKDLKVSATRVGITSRKEKLEAEIAEVDSTLQQEVATLQAQIEAIRGIAETVIAPVVLEESEDLV